MGPRTPASYNSRLDYGDQHLYGRKRGRHVRGKRSFLSPHSDMLGDMGHPEPPSDGTITTLLAAVRDGSTEANERLFDRVYGELRLIARSQVSRLGVEAFEATGLIGAAYERLAGKEALNAEDRRHLFFLFGRAMHDILVEHVRSEQSLKRGGGVQHVTLVELQVEDDRVRADLVDLAEALQALERVDPDSARIAILRYYTGRSLREAAEIMGMSFAVARRHWDYAKAWLLERLSRNEGDRSSDNPPTDGIV